MPLSAKYCWNGGVGVGGAWSLLPFSQNGSQAGCRWAGFPAARTTAASVEFAGLTEPAGPAGHAWQHHNKAVLDPGFDAATTEEARAACCPGPQPRLPLFGR